MAGNVLYYGDNLIILRDKIADASVDLVYLDPPFKSNQDYNVLFKEKNGTKAAAQIKAFEDTWSWTVEAEEAYRAVVVSGGRVSEVLQAFRKYLGTSDMMAYLCMMAPRLIELHRVLKHTGSLFLHCDPTASHYLKVLVDAVFGPANFRNEIIWKRQTAHSDAKYKFCDVADIILFAAKSKDSYFEPVYVEHDPEYIRKFYKHDDDDGRGLYQLDNMASPNPRPNLMYDWLGYPYPPKGWRYQKETMQKLHDEGRIYYPMNKSGLYDYEKRPRLKRYLNERKGSIVTNIWIDINPLHAVTSERLGYPTQKPEALLQRIIEAASHEGDTVLDPFCGCGTTVSVAQKLNRNWIGIDITYLAVALIKTRLVDTFGVDIAFEVNGEPEALAGAKALFKQDPFEFQRWAVSKICGFPVEAQRGADKGIDGRIYFHDEHDTAETKQIIISVKGGHTGVAHIRDLRGVIEREKAEIGVFITLEPPTKPMTAEAAEAGFYESPWTQKKYPRLQILTIEELLEGKEIACPHRQPLDKTFKKAPKAKRKKEEPKELEF